MVNKTQFPQLLTQLYLQTDFKVPYSAFQIGDFVFLGSMKQGRKLRRKKFVTDFDGVFEAEGTQPLYKLFFKYLAEKNPAIDTNVIDDYIRSIFSGKPVKEVFGEMRDYLKSKDFRRSQYYRACELAANNWQPNSEAWRTLKEIREMGYDLTIISGSPKHALELAANKIGFEDYEIIGSRYEFDNSGRLIEIYPMLGEEKLKQKRRIVGNEPQVAITDDIDTDYFITSGAELAIIVADKDSSISQNERDVYLFDKQIRKKFGSVIDYIRKFEYSFARAYKTSESSETMLLLYIQRLKKTQNKKEFIGFLKMLRTELAEFDPFSLMEEQTVITKYEFEQDTEKEKKLNEEIFSTLEKVPEFVDTEAFAKALGIENGVS